MVRVPTLAEEDAKRPNRERECLLKERTRKPSFTHPGKRCEAAVFALRLGMDEYVTPFSDDKKLRLRDGTPIHVGILASLTALRNAVRSETSQESSSARQERSRNFKPTLRKAAERLAHPQRRR